MVLVSSSRNTPYTYHPLPDLGSLQRKPTHGALRLSRPLPSAVSSLDVSALPSPESVPKMEQSSIVFLQFNVYVGEETVNVLALAVIIDRLFPRLKVPHTIKMQSEDFQGRDDRLARMMEGYVGAIQAARRVCG